MSRESRYAREDRLLEQARDYLACSVCGAAPGRPCRSTGYGPTVTGVIRALHSGRLRDPGLGNNRLDSPALAGYASAPLADSPSNLCEDLLNSGSSRAALLPPWVRQPYRLWSLLDMLEAYAFKFANVCVTLESMKAPGALSPASVKPEVFLPAIGRLLKQMELDELVEHIDVLRMSRTLRRLVKRLMENLRGRPQVTEAKLVAIIGEVEEAILGELEGALFFAVPPSSEELYDQQELFGPEVNANFGRSSFHIKEAGNCLAFARWTAAIYHLMCILEAGLDSMADALNLPASQKNWQNVLDHIKNAIAALGPASGPTWKEDQAFFSTAALEFRLFKPWRNDVAHGRAKATEEEAKKILTHVRSFMIHLSSRLKERP